MAVHCHAVPVLSTEAKVAVHCHTSEPSRRARWRCTSCHAGELFECSAIIDKFVLRVLQ